MERKYSIKNLISKSPLYSGLVGALLISSGCGNRFGSHFALNQDSRERILESRQQEKIDWANRNTSSKNERTESNKVGGFVAEGLIHGLPGILTN